MILRGAAKEFNPRFRFIFFAGLIVFIFLSLRLTYLTTSIESTSWNEELYRGSIAREFLEGPHLKFWDYPADHYDGGSLWMGLLTVPIFAIFGASLFTLKLVPLLLAVLTLFLSLIVIQKIAGNSASLYACSLWALAPPTCIKLSLVNIGSHPESPLFLVWILLALSLNLKNNPKPNYFLYTGFAWGLAYSFSPINLIAIVAASLTLVFYRTRIPLRFFLGLLLGLIPWLIYNVHHNWCGLKFLSDSFLPTSPIHIQTALFSLIKKLGIILICMVPSSAGFQSMLRWSPQHLSMIYFLIIYFLTVGFYLQYFWNSFQRAEGPSKTLTFFVLYPMIYLLAYGVSQYRVFTHPQSHFFAYTYLTPLIFSLIMSAGVFLSKIKWGRFVLSALMLVSLGGHIPYLFREKLFQGLRYSGTNDFELGAAIRRLQPQDSLATGRAYAEIKLYPASRRRKMWWGFFDSISSPLWTSINDLNQLAKKYPVESYPYLMYAAGASVGPSMLESRSPDFLNHISELRSGDLNDFFWGLSWSLPINRIQTTSDDLQLLENRWPKSHRKWLMTAFGLCAGSSNLDSPANRFTFFSQYTHEPDFLHGQGQSFAGDWASSLETPVPVSKISFPPDSLEREKFMEGVGWGLTQFFLFDRTRIQDWIVRLPPKDHAAAYRGASDASLWFDLS